MQSKTSFFNKTVLRKNLTRFAPVWGVYTLCLVMGILLLYTNGGSVKQFHFANNVADMIYVMAAVNFCYALLVAQLLFGDLYNSRSCNMLHAFPLKRECWFVTNVVSGLVFSLVPTGVMALVAMPLLLNSVFAGAWTLSWWLFLASNLQYACFFGMASFAAMCVGNRFTMTAGYGLLNVGAYIVYWLIDTIYTPLLYGVVTPTALTYALTPIAQMCNHPYIQSEVNLYDLQKQFGEKLEGAVAVFTVSDQWWRLWVLAAVGIGFALLAMVLYRKRHLECAGDAVAFPVLVPVFQVLCALFVATAAQFSLYVLGIAERNYPILAAGLVVGWFIAKMMLERSTRVFRLKNCYGLAALAAVITVSLWMTSVDIFGIETRLPDGEKVKSVYFATDYSNGVELTEQADIDDMIRLQECALNKRAEDGSGYYVMGTNGQWLRYGSESWDLIDRENGDPTDYRNVTHITLKYELDSGKQIRRRYNIWVDSEAGDIAEDYLNRWDFVNYQQATISGKKYDRLQLVLQDLESMYVDRADEKKLKEISTRENALELLEAIQADCAEGNMAQHPYFHTGHFRYENEYAEDGYNRTTELQIMLEGKEYTWWISVFPDSAHTLAWLEAHDLLNVEVRTERHELWNKDDLR